ncbi:MAG: RbsD/FucU domain-containing protein [Candidatus Saccharibacteria bacterium]
MPPLKGIDRGINGNMLKVLEESGHGDRIVVIDPSYSVPEGAKVIDYQGDSSASALVGILRLVPSESVITIMDADPSNEVSNRAGLEFIKSLGGAGLMADLATPLPRLTEDAPVGQVGFYELVNGIEVPTIFVRTRDELAYACATFIVGHSQE